MDYLIKQFSDVGYPLWVFYFSIIVGFSLAIIKPFYGFLFSVFGLSAKNFHAAVNTRLQITGEFLNLADLFFWIAVFSMSVQIIRFSKRKFTFPKIILILAFIIIISSLQSVFRYGVETFVLRSIWYIIIFPIMFIVGSNMVQTEDEAKYFYWVLFVGASVAAFQHMVFLFYSYVSGIRELSQLRTISYMFSGLYYLLLSILFTNKPQIKGMNNTLYISGIGMMMISIIMNQTRQMYVITLLTILLIPFLLRGIVQLTRNLLITIIAIAASVVIFSYLFSDINILNVLEERMEFARDREVFADSYFTRNLGMKTELDLFINSNILFGYGAAYPPEYSERYEKGDLSYVEVTGALNHVAFSSYLAHLGIMGFLFFLVFLPYYTFINSRRLLAEIEKNSYIFKILIMGVSLSIMDIANAFGSMLHTSVGCHIPALIYGACWGIFSRFKQ